MRGNVMQFSLYASCTMIFVFPVFKVRMEPDAVGIRVFCAATFMSLTFHAFDRDYCHLKPTSVERQNCNTRTTRPHLLDCSRSWSRLPSASETYLNMDMVGVGRIDAAVARDSFAIDPQDMSVLSVTSKTVSHQSSERAIQVKMITGDQADAASRTCHKHSGARISFNANITHSLWQGQCLLSKTKLLLCFVYLTVLLPFSKMFGFLCLREHVLSIVSWHHISVTPIRIMMFYRSYRWSSTSNDEKCSSIIFVHRIMIMDWWYEYWMVLCGKTCLVYDRKSLDYHFGCSLGFLMTQMKNGSAHWKQAT